MTDDEATQIKAILAHLDAASEAGEYPFPQHDRMDYAGMRLHAYRGETPADHLLLFEMLVHDRRFGGFCNHVFLYGSRGGVRGQAAWEDGVFPETIEDDPDGASPFLSEEEAPGTTVEQRSQLNPAARAVMVREERVALTFDPAVYRAHGIEPSDPIALRDLLRLLVATHREALFSTAEERARIGKGLTEILTLDELHHLDFDEHAAPSETEAMRMIAEVLATGDVKRYAPTEPPNTDWRVVTRQVRYDR